MKKVLLAIAFLGTFLQLAHSAVPFSATADDGLLLRGTLYFPPGVKEARPLVILLPMMANDRKSWGEFPKQLSAAGYAVLAIDQRGHGESIWQGKKKKVFSSFTNSDFARMVTDIGSVLQALSKQKTKIDLNRVAIYGASIGANVALVFGASHPEVKAVALLSPGLDYRGITTEEAAGSFGDRSALVAAAKGDNYAAMSAQKLALKIGATATLKIFEGSEHGTRLFNEEKDFGKFLLDWTASNFPVSTAAAK